MSRRMPRRVSLPFPFVPVCPSSGSRIVKLILSSFHFYP
jgi:hypothetical protein